MLRAFVLAIAANICTSEAHACIVSDGFTGMLFDDIPTNARSDDVVLNVEFSWQAVRDSDHLNAVVTGHVLKVVRGEFHGNAVRVGLPNSSCDYPFIFGRRGLLIGHLVTIEQGHALVGNETWDVGSPEGPLHLDWPYSETVFVPMSETVAARRQRTGRDGVRHWPD